LNFHIKKEQAAEEAKQQRWIKCGKAGSKYQGVSWDKSSNKWVASIRCDGKRHSLGRFEDEEKAARAYDRAARAHHGEKARLNFPTEGERGSRKSSQYQGVCWDKRNNKWKVRLNFDNKDHSPRALDALRLHLRKGVRCALRQCFSGLFWAMFLCPVRACFLA
jgi:hypothetical protein